MSNAAIIVAAGRGTRMGPGMDKIFLPVAGHPVIAHSWRAFEACPQIDSIVLVVREGMEAHFERLAAELGFRKPFRLAAGGPQRQDSVWNGLQQLDAGVELVAIHDGARPCVTQELILATLEAARRTGAATAAHPLTDTIKKSEDGRLISGTLDRSKLWAVQTPQTFRVEIIRRALEEAQRRGLSLTDDNAACELVGQPVELVHCKTPNPKVTVPSDLPWIEWLLKNAQAAAPC